MNDGYPWKVYNKVLDEKICDFLIEYCQTLKKIPGLVGHQSEINQNYRNTLISFLQEDHWMMGVFYHYAAIQNIMRSKYDLSGPAPIQYAEYTQGQHYRWHSDSGDIPVNAETVRKVTCILQLTDDNDFEGGDLELRLGIDTEDIKVFTIKEMRTKGTLITFPSSISHRVTEVKDGTRKSLTGWILGMPFR